MTSLPTALLRVPVRARYLLILGVALGCAVPGYHSSVHSFNDWLEFEIGARTLIHWHHFPMYSIPALHLYTYDDFLQIGPPPLLLLAGFQWLSPHTVNHLFVALMCLLGVGSLAAAEAAARTLRPDQTVRIQRLVLLGGLPAAAAWGYEAGQFHHLDDALALAGAAMAIWLCARGRSVWWIGVCLGVALASKPWAIVMAPLLLGLPRPKRAPAALVVIGVAAAFWAPFVVAAPQTIHALGGYRILPQPGSTLHLIGVHGNVSSWLRPVQFGLGLLVATLVARRGRWTAAPLAGIAVRVALDPYAWAYYGLGPVLVALVWDLTRPGDSRLPRWTLWTLLVEFGLRLPVSAAVPATGRVLWVASVLLGLFATVRWPLTGRHTPTADHAEINAMARGEALISA